MPELDQANLPVPIPLSGGNAVPGAPARPPAQFGAHGSEEGGFDWRRFASALVRYRWLVLAFTLLGTAVGGVLSRFVPPVYLTEATILVPERASRGSDGPIQPDVLFQTGGWVELIKTSFIVLDDVVRDLRLYLNSEPTDSAAFGTFGLKDRFRPGEYELVVDRTGESFQLRVARGANVQLGRIGDSIGREVGFAWLPPAGSLQPGKTLGFSVVPPRDVARRLQADVRARLNERGANMLSISLEGPNPARLAATVNGIAAGFVDSARALSLSKHRELTRTLKLQLDSADRRLREAEIAYEAYRVGTYTLPRERATPVAPGVQGTTDPALDNYTSMKLERDRLERDREAVEAALAASADTGVAPDELSYIEAVRASRDLNDALGTLSERQTQLTELQLRYTDQNPEVQRVTREVDELRRRAIPDLARGLVSQLVTRERVLDDRIAAAGRELQQVPRRATEEQRRERQVELAEFQYQNLERQYQDALYAQAAEELGARVLDSAVVPSRPLRDTALATGAMGVLLGLGLGLVSVFLLDRIDRRVRYPDQVSAGLGLPILGAIPRVKSAGNGHGTRGPDALQVVEALRGIRLGLLHAHGVAGPMMLTITSPGPGEGKSFVASNLALAFAEAGHRTLLVDGDIRRGALHRVIEANRKPGLTDFLRNGASGDEVVQRTRYPSLFFVGGGTRLHSGPELLSSPVLGQWLLSVRSAYDVILVDSPPLGAGVDPFVLGTTTGNMVLVLRTGVTDRELAGAKLDMLDRLPIRVLGAILNDVQSGGLYRYYYGYHTYLDGYETQDETPDADVLPRAVS